MFWVLDANLDRRRLEGLRSRFLRERRRGPTHPHPLAPHTPAAASVAGPLAAALDRVGDALAGARRGRHGGGA